MSSPPPPDLQDSLVIQPPPPSSLPSSSHGIFLLNVKPSLSSSKMLFVLSTALPAAESLFQNLLVNHLY